MKSLSLLAAASDGGLTHGAVLVLACFAVVLAYAVWASAGHFRGRGGCCGGGGSAPPPVPGKEIGPVVARRELALDGLRCMNCVHHAKKALNAIPGVAADVTLDPPRALVRTDRDVPDAALRAAVEAEGYRVVSIARR
jgi:copper chaperone CopZ